MITITNLSKNHGRKVLFEKLDLRINRGEKIGLIGPNGAGKTTLFSIILGKVEPSTGSIQITRNIRIGYLPQESSFKSKVSVLTEVVEGDKTIMSLKKEKETLEAQNKAVSPRYGDIVRDLEFLGYFELEHRAKKILAGLGFKEADFSRSINQMSGGWQMRTLLAKLLTCHYDILLLDEPTNYLDLGAALWLKDYLIGFKGTFIIISHDEDFLNEVTTYTLILENSAIAKIKGNYEDYQKQKEERHIHLLRRFTQQEKKRQQLKKFISRFHAQPNKASQVRTKKKMLEKMEIITVPQDRRESIRSFHFPQGERSGYKIITLEKIFKSYGDITVYKNFDFEMFRGEKAVLVGANGAGKSTLLKIMAGVIAVDSGLRSLGHNVSAGYFSQTRMDVLNPYNTVFEEASSAAGGRITGENIRTILGAFLFTGNDVDKNVAVLSGGEKSRLILAKLLIKPPNFLLLDEPTTHLDTDAVDALIKALKEYDGTLAFISHDVHFVRSVANTVFEVKDGRLRKFPGDFNYYWHKSKEKTLVEERKQVVLGKRAGTNEVTKKEKQKQLQAQTGKKIHKEYNEKLVRRIKKLNKKKEKLMLERYAKNRVATNPRHGQEIIRYYIQLLGEIDQQILRVEKEINQLKSQYKKGAE